MGQHNQPKTIFDISLQLCLLHDMVPISHKPRLTPFRHWRSELLLKKHIEQRSVKVTLNKDCFRRNTSPLKQGKKLQIYYILTSLIMSWISPCPLTVIYDIITLIFIDLGIIYWLYTMLFKCPMTSVHSHTFTLAQ